MSRELCCGRPKSEPCLIYNFNAIGRGRLVEKKIKEREREREIYRN